MRIDPYKGRLPWAYSLHRPRISRWTVAGCAAFWVAVWVWAHL